MQIKKYNREKAILYAKKWAYSRNPKYYNYDKLGGDCTNFISQCLYAGTGIMNYDKNNGWYYNNGNDKSPSWTGVEFLYKFIIQNKNVSIFGRETIKENIEEGDVIQLSFDGKSYGHSLIIINNQELTIASHTFDSYDRKLSTYNYKKARFIHIEGVRK